MLLIGDGAVGKTSLAKRFLTGLFAADTKLMVGADFYIKLVEMGKTRVLLQIWDFGGNKGFALCFLDIVTGRRGQSSRLT